MSLQLLWRGWAIQPMRYTVRFTDIGLTEHSERQKYRGGDEEDRASEREPGPLEKSPGRNRGLIRSPLHQTAANQFGLSPLKWGALSSAPLSCPRGGGCTRPRVRLGPAGDAWRGLFPFLAASGLCASRSRSRSAKNVHFRVLISRGRSVPAASKKGHFRQYSSERHALLPRGAFPANIFAPSRVACSQGAGSRTAISECHYVMTHCAGGRFNCRGGASLARLTV
jgi:hypothetical protein